MSNRLNARLTCHAAHVCSADVAVAADRVGITNGVEVGGAGVARAQSLAALVCAALAGALDLMSVFDRCQSGGTADGVAVLNLWRDEESHGQVRHTLLSVCL